MKTENLIVVDVTTITKRKNELLAEWQEQEDKGEEVDTAIQVVLMTAIDELNDVLENSKPLDDLVREEAVNQDELWGNVFAKIKQYGLNNEVLQELKNNFTIFKKQTMIKEKTPIGKLKNSIGFQFMVYTHSGSPIENCIDNCTRLAKDYSTQQLSNLLSKILEHRRILYTRSGLKVHGVIYDLDIQNCFKDFGIEIVEEKKF